MGISVNFFFFFFFGGGGESFGSVMRSVFWNSNFFDFDHFHKEIKC